VCLGLEPLSDLPPVSLERSVVQRRLLLGCLRRLDVAEYASRLRGTIISVTVVVVAVDDEEEEVVVVRF